ncbi:MAG: two-component sensor histidine kinase [Planctomycetota bacterium]|jgi:two-component sensor histidine kinase
MSARSFFNLEGFLRSRWGQAFFVAALVVIVSLAMSVPRFEIAELRGGETNRMRVFLHELVQWGAWGLASCPIVWVTHWALAKHRSWILFFLLQIPLSGICGWGSLQLNYHLRELAGPIGGPHPSQEERPRDLRQENPGRGPFRPGGREDQRDRDRDRSNRRPGGGRWDEGPNWGTPFWRHRWMSAVLVYWVLVGMGAGLQSFLGMRNKERRAAELELRAERLRAELVRAQLGSLRSQLNPHFLFNSLHSVGGLVRAGEDQTALSTLAAIGDLLRSTLDHDGAETVVLGDELRIAERLLEIEKIRLGERLVVVFEVDDETRFARVPGLILLPLVENAVHHGLANLPEGGRVLVQAKKEGETLRLVVEDDGEGFSRDVLEHAGSKEENGRRSIGLENTRDRLLALYGPDQAFELSNCDPRGARVRISLPFSTDEES